MKRTPMPPRTKAMPRGKGLASSSSLKTRTPLRARSDKQRRKYEIRGPLVAWLLITRPWCEIRWDANCWRRATEVHEPEMRSRGTDICDEAKCKTACHYCHRMVHDHPAEATRRGWLVPSGKKRRAA